MMGLFEFLYYLGYRLNTFRDLRNQRRLPAKVISIGNITTGGAGKTPLAIAMAEEAILRGLKPVLLTRGYKGRKKGPCLITPDMSEKDAGDEPLLMAKRLKGVPIIKDSDRYRGGASGIAEPLLSDTLFILDDGYQHRKLFRDLDILLISAINPFNNKKLLPVGHLREPLSEIKRAHMIVITNAIRGGRSADVESLIASIRKYNPSAPVFVAGHRISYVSAPNGERFTAGWLRGKDLFAFCGIGEPESFISGLLGAGANLKGVKKFSDHHRYDRAEIEGISKAAESKKARWIITTEKDIMRLEGLSLPDNLVYAVVDFAVGREFYDEVFLRLKALG